MYTVINGKAGTPARLLNHINSSQYINGTIDKIISKSHRVVNTLRIHFLLAFNIEAKGKHKSLDL